MEAGQQQNWMLLSSPSIMCDIAHKCYHNIVVLVIVHASTGVLEQYTDISLLLTSMTCTWAWPVAAIQFVIGLCKRAGATCNIT